MRTGLPLITIILLMMVPLSTTMLFQLPSEDSVPNQYTVSTTEMTPSLQSLNADLRRFTSNEGQVPDDDLLFYAVGEGLSTGFGNGWFSFKLDGDKTVVVQRCFVDCNEVSPVGVGPTDERTNYLIGNDPAGWVTGARNYRELLYQDLWDGIDLRVHISDGALKYEFIGAPGADPTLIRMRHEGVDDLYLGPGGDLVMETRNGCLVDEAPTTFHDLPGGRSVVESGYVVEDKVVRFSLGPYDPRLPLVIDPSLDFCTYIGGSSREYVEDHFVDENGSIYMVGITESLDFPTTPGVYDRIIGREDIFVMKMNPDGSSLDYSTFVGGANSSDFGSAIWVDSLGRAYVTGYTVGGRDFPTTPGNFSSKTNDYYDIVLFKLDENGSHLLFSDIIHGASGTNEYPKDVIVDDMGDIFIAGQAGYLSDFCHPGAFQDRPQGGGDAFVMKVDATGKSIRLCTLLGGGELDVAEAMVLGANGDVYITGRTSSDDLPMTSNAYCSTFSGNSDVFVARLDANLSNLTYSTFFGGSGIDYGNSIAMDAKGSVYVTGYGTPGFPTTKGAYDEVMNGSTDAYVLKLAANGTLDYSTLLGGTEREIGYGLTVYDGGCALVTGYTESSDYPTTQGAYARNKDIYRDVFLTKLSPDGTSLRYSTFIGGDHYDDGFDVSVPGGGFVHVSGRTRSQSFPTTQGAYCTTYSGGDWDSFLLRMDIDGPWIYEDSTANATSTGDPLQINVTMKDNVELKSVVVEYWFGATGHVQETMDKTSGTSKNATYVLNLTAPPDSLETLRYFFRATDAADNVNISSVREVAVVDDDLPEFRDMTSRVPTTGDPFSFSVDARDNIGVDDVRVVYWFGDQAGGAVNESMTGSGNDRYDHNVPTIPTNTRGPLHYRFWANDTSGNWNSTSVLELQVIDDDLPFLGEDGSDGSATTGDPLIFRLNCSDNIGPSVVTVSLWYDETSPVHLNLSMEGLAVDAGGNGTYGLVWTVFPDLVHPLHYRFHVSDLAGNWNSTVERVVNVTDNDPPEFLDDRSDEKASTGRDYTFLVEVIDNIDLTYVNVSYWFGGENATNVSMDLQSVQGPGRGVYVITINVPEVIPGTMAYRFLATDGACNVNASAERTVAIDDTTPPSMVEDLSDARATTGDPYTFRILVRDNVGIAGVNVSWRIGDGSVEELVMEAVDGTGSNEVAYQVLVDAPSDVTDQLRYSFLVTDLAGNPWSSSERSVPVVDNDPPTLVEDLTEGEAVKGLPLTFSVHFVDNVWLDAVWVEYRYGDGVAENESMTLGDAHHLVMTTSRHPTGSLAYRYHAVDGRGNWVTTALTIVTLINSPPQVSDIPVWVVVEEQDEILDLSPYISDENDGEFEMNCDDPNVTVTAFVLGVRVMDWAPDRTITVTISDGEDSTDAIIVLRIQNVNDPPGTPEITSPHDGGRFERGKDVTFEATFDDPDMGAGQLLTVIWNSDRDGELGRFTSDNILEISTTELSAGAHTIMVTVDDGEESSSNTLRITVFEEEGDTDGISTTSWAVLVIAILIAIIVGAYLVRKRNIFS